MENNNAYYWATHAGAELNLLIFNLGKRIGFECKYQDSPVVTKSMRIAFNDLKLKKLYIIYPGSKSYILDNHIQVIALKDLSL